MTILTLSKNINTTLYFNTPSFTKFGVTIKSFCSVAICMFVDES